MHVKDVCAAMEVWAPKGLAYEWDPVGLRIGEPDAEVTGVLATLSVTREGFEEARGAGANVIVSHHPFPWRPLAVFRPNDPETRLALDIVNAGMACYAAHTNMDVVPGGVNYVLAETLGLDDPRPLLPVDHAEQVKLVTYAPEAHVAAIRQAICEAAGGGQAWTGTGWGEGAAPEETGERRIEVTVNKARIADAAAALKGAHPSKEPPCELYSRLDRDPEVGLGVRGELPAPRTLGDLARHVRAALETDHVRVAGKARAEVARVALIGGSGGGEIPNIPADIDVLITGDVKYHQAMAALERGLSVIDAGHHGTEKGIVTAMTRHLKQRLAGVNVCAYTEPDPFRAVTG